jgi:cellulose synthase/poly-beta-1,6-N-acetylglucosamine synthase-like glycosyltransferase
LFFWTAVFWLSLLGLVYVYSGYPLLAWLLGGALDRRVQKAARGAHQPTVTVLIAAFNEARHIEATVRNKLAQNYPADRLDVIVVSDASDDGTDELVRAIGGGRVRLIRQEPRAGKTSGLNLAMPHATGEIIVFSDANSLYAMDTVARLAGNFADSDVGYVTGRMVYRAPDGSLTGEGCSLYMRYENQLRDWETKLGSIVGVDGGVDAMRRSLYRPMRADQLPDFVQPLRVREQGYRVVYEPEALLYEDALAATGDEYRMRVRVALRAFHALKDMAVLLDPARYGLFAWQLWSHKVMRYLAFVFMAGCLVAAWFLADRAGTTFWKAAMVAQIAFYAAAVYGHVAGRNGRGLPRLAGLATYLCVLNLASAQAFWQFLRGRKQVIWKPRT